ncbi:Uncharacterized protein FKW44_018083, partial [Caligus rogercresseyi]
KAKSVTWNQEAQAAFDTVKAALANTLCSSIQALRHKLRSPLMLQTLLSALSSHNDKMTAPGSLSHSSPGNN